MVRNFKDEILKISRINIAKQHIQIEGSSDFTIVKEVKIKTNTLSVKLLQYENHSGSLNYTGI